MTRARPATLADSVEHATQRVHSGEAPSEQEYECANANESAELGELISILRLLHDIGTRDPGINELPAQSSSTPSGADKKVLGDYRLLHEVGRGGMGVVYEAEQISLQRRVALKLLPQVSTLDSKRLRRFKNESQAAASLDHPHIVPIYAVGCAEDVHYFAMPLIEGESLATLIAHLQRPNRKRATEVHQSLDAVESKLTPSSSFERHGGCRPGSGEYHRAVAWLGLQAADALQHTHDAGLIHRDIKPSNLLVTREGHLWVTDFGLARFPGDASLTASGELVGTARFMSPEQTQAKLLVVDHRTDIYSLGATLYELLTLRAAFSGDDRETLLRKIRSVEPRRVRNIDRSIPRDLETIVHKAMTKAPDERYMTARELADDLQRFLSHESIWGKPPSVVDRAMKLTRRHASAIASILVVLTLFVVIVLIATVSIVHERDSAKQAAERERVAAQLAREERATANRQRELSEKSFKRAHQLVDAMFERAAYDLGGVPHSDPIRHALLEDAFGYYQALHLQNPGDLDVEYDTARALDRVGQFHMRLGALPEAEQAMQEARTTLERLARQQPENAEKQLSLAHNLQGLAELCKMQADQRDEEERLNDQRVELLSSLLETDPEVGNHRCELACALTARANLHVSAGRLHEAESDFRHAMRLRERNELLTSKTSGSCLGMVSTLHGLGKLSLSTRRLSEGGRLLIQAWSLQKDLVRDSPFSEQLQHDLADIERELARWYCLSGEPARAENHVRRAVEICQQLVHDHPDAVDYHALLASSRQAQARVLWAMEDRTTAQQTLDQSSEHLAGVIETSGGTLSTLLLLAENHFLSAAWSHLSNELKLAKDSFWECRRLLQECISKFPTAAAARTQLAYFLVACPDPEFRDAGRAIELSKDSSQRKPELAQHYRLLGMASYRVGQLNASAEALRKARELAGGVDASDSFLLAMVHARRAEWAEAKYWYQSAIQTSQHNCWDSERLSLLKVEAAPLFEQVHSTPSRQ